MNEGVRIMLYFGSFNPIHKAHIAIAEYVIERKLADKVVLIVSPQNPHKDPAGLAPEFCRFEMAEMAAASSKYPDRIEVSAIEMTLPKPSYTINTLRFLAEAFPKTEFSILIGGDNANTLGSWKDAEEITGNYDIYIYPRAGQTVDNPSVRVKVMEDAPLFDICSTEIRDAITRGESIEEKVPALVADYIHKNGLWR